MFTSIAVTPVNHVLHSESWACQRLQAYAGKTVRVQNFLLPDFIFSIQDNGEIIDASNDTPPDATIVLTPGLLARLLVKDEAAFDLIKTSGDAALAKAAIEVGKNLRWDVAQDLSKVIGDIPAHRAVQAGENIIHWHTDNIYKLAQALSEYLTEEQPMLANKVYINEFVREVNSLRDDVEQLEQRLQKLINQTNTLT